MLNGVFTDVLRRAKSGLRINLRLEDLLSFETLFKRSGLFFFNSTQIDKKRGSKLKQGPPRIFLKVWTFLRLQTDSFIHKNMKDSRSATT